MKKSYGGKRRDDNPDVGLSKKLAWLLRHGAEKEGLNMGSDGYVLLQEIMSRNDFSTITFDKVKSVVDNNDKKRFEMIQKEHNGKIEWFIRASQGHTISSINDEELLDKISLDVASSLGIVVHGTYKQFWEPISKEGLKTMQRNHIHFAIGYPGDKEVISGMRKTCDVYIEIDLVKAINDGIDFFMSKNNVVLTSGINKVLPPKYFKVVKDRNGKILFAQPEKLVEQKDDNKEEIEEQKQSN
ncbi:RNA 2'-phosphotransferase, Tpt1/KptA family protein (macronuclear) [Tetrahymena thermophila SB210]|uniref:2'-phosphotransferase n=1 Tax=Tetrahymena thermophila (strain SB210) TaxID=312017 RepID=Q23CN1_TETTS|nr:RNA 2'-phosphotransferase, Tpt1/KptA family protein [Tetrahymena thermophila SB210]EAR94249.1 RNA 2'-phosphotransferase, Tpt1/KptA family protein [Tetrahymena thermophila SB210]|eukprot:XP_001014494.1 RNA 2'-phosphotransferase, Tpt1/KptA family protein [Tetrahymena thermophila SB210]